MLPTPIRRNRTQCEFVNWVVMSENLDLLDRYGIDLETGINELGAEGNWAAFLDISSKFITYSSFNLLLIFSQACKRGFTPSLVAGYKSWQKLGRHVIRGEKALYIFAPRIKRETEPVEFENLNCASDKVVGFRLVSVFDVCQTVGEELPLPPEPVLLGDDGLHFAAALVSLVHYLECLGFNVGFEKLDGVNGYTDFTRKSVRVRSDVTNSQMLKTLIHETAHVLLHSVNKISRPQAELEAESCAYLVCRLLGVDSSSYSFPYVARWSKGDVRQVTAAIRAIKKCALGIVNEIEGSGSVKSGNWQRFTRYLEGFGYRDQGQLAMEGYLERSNLHY